VLMMEKKNIVVIVNSRLFGEKDRKKIYLLKKKSKINK